MTITKKRMAELGSVHGIDIIENNVSGYYVADEISGIYRGMMIAIPDDHWIVFQQMSIPELVTVLQKLSENVKLSRFRKYPRNPKKPQPKRKSCKNSPNVATARLLAARYKEVCHGDSLYFSQQMTRPRYIKFCAIKI